ncbi:dihydroorotase [Lawsonella clevelandensis]|uniref:dihydroorotase n=2 Tax=Lawsonella clevelandensis TaxID=1528099 RepID=UPI000A40815F|nr:dihydroorotase [Lawsonella clevelandensis]MDU7193544.1 dihydroorotase [Lawsonella clevelandensis]
MKKDTMTALIIRNVRLYGEGDAVDVLVHDGRIDNIAAHGTLTTLPTECEEYDGRGNVLLPGFVDIHVHLREPGREDTETIASGSAAAAIGGFTAVYTMPNTNPVIDNNNLAEMVWSKGQEIGLCDVYPVGSITVGLQGKELSEMGLMNKGKAQVRWFSDDGKCVNNPLVMRRALEYAAGLGATIAQHAEEDRLTEGAIAHEGPMAAKLGMKGWPRAAEESIVARDILLARDAHAHIHVCHASTKGTVELLKWAHEQGVNITAEVTPHHLLLNDSVLPTYNGVYRVNPPLREESDNEALQQALIDGVIDCVATDHAPHGSEETCCEFAKAANGMLGLETSLAIMAQVMVESGRMTWRDIARIMSERPAKLVGLADHGRPLEVGEPANLTVIDPDAGWCVHGEELASIASNTPYEGMEFRARPVLTVLRGRVTARDGEAAL